MLRGKQNIHRFLIATMCLSQRKIVHFPERSGQFGVKMLQISTLSLICRGWNSSQVAFFSKYISKSRAKRLPLTTKRAGKGYYKGNGARKEGMVTSKGTILAFYS